MKMIFDESDYRQLESGETYNDKFVIIKLESFKPQYRNALFQLFLAKSGFGCDPTKMGNAVFGYDYAEGYRQERYNILGVATEEAIKAWEDYYHISREDFGRCDNV